MTSSKKSNSNKKTSKINIEKMNLENKYSLRMAAIICNTILGAITTIGIFWGKENLLIGLTVLGVFSLIIFFSALGMLTK